MPVIEAMACVWPVTTSNTSACAEIAGNAALLVNPSLTDAITQAMRRLVDDAVLWKGLRTFRGAISKKTGIHG